MTSLEKQKLNVPEAATQFQISLPMRFRIMGERVWREGCVDSMSLTAIVFRGEEEMEIGTAFDIRLVLPRVRSNRRGGTIVSRGKVTRSWPLSETPGQVFVAAALTGPRLLRFSPENGQT